jgi:hypothetical protein
VSKDAHRGSIECHIAHVHVMHHLCVHRSELVRIRRKGEDIDKGALKTAVVQVVAFDGFELPMLLLLTQCAQGMIKGRKITLFATAPYMNQ